MTALKDIVHETAEHWVLKTAKGFEVYRNEATHSVRCATIGFQGAEGMRRALAEIDRRESAA